MQHKAVSPRQQMLWEGLWTLYGNQENFRFENGILTTRDCWVADESAPLENFDFRFSARAPETAPEAEIWAGFHHANREYRYMVGLRGGSHKHLYLARLGAVGYDRMLALCPLEWSPEPGGVVPGAGCLRRMPDRRLPQRRRRAPHPVHG